MIRNLLSIFEPFVLVLLGTVLFASLLPPTGSWADAMAIVAKIGIVLLFFLHGAKLSREAVIGGMRHWRLHLTVLAMTFLLFPLLGLAVIELPGLSPAIAGGLLFLTLLPSTVQSSIAFTSIAGGNVAAAVCSASFSNLAGIVITPLLVMLLMGGNGMGSDGAITAVESIVLQLMLPFLAGHLLRPLIGGLVARYKSIVAKVDRGSILLVVYSAFGAAVRDGLWHRITTHDLLLLLLLCAALLAVVLAASWSAARLLALDREDAVVLLFCGSKKSLASGVPLAGLLFPAAAVGTAILPLMLFHQLQLIVCAGLAKNLARKAAQQQTQLTPSGAADIDAPAEFEPR